MAILVTPPVAEPLTLDEAKLHLRVDGNDENGLIEGFIASARATAEDRCQIALLPQVWRAEFPRFPLGCGYIELSRPPFIAVQSLTYINDTGATVTMAAADYLVSQSSLLAQIHHAYGKSWPEARQQPGAVQVEWRAGYNNAASVPAPIKSWMKLMIGTLYENREVIIRGQTSASSFIPRGFSDALLDPYRVPCLA